MVDDNALLCPVPVIEEVVTEPVDVESVLMLDDVDTELLETTEPDVEGPVGLFDVVLLKVPEVVEGTPLVEPVGEDKVDGVEVAPEDVVELL